MTATDGAQTLPTDGLPKMSRRSKVLQTVGYFIGLAILGWCVQVALSEGDWSRVRDPKNVLLVCGVVAASIASIILNGVLFRLTLEPVRPRTSLRGQPRTPSLPSFFPLIGVNWVCTLANFAPLRMGMIARITYHMRVDQLRFSEIVPWFALDLMTFLLPIGGVLGATLITRSFGWLWGALAIGLTALLCYVLWWMSRHHWIPQRFRETARITGDARSLLICVPLRCIDLAFNGLRTILAAKMLGIELDLADGFALACAGLLASLGPLGRLGFREAGFALFAQLLIARGFDSGIDAAFVQLSIIDSAGEAIAALLGGIPLSIWMTRRMLKGAARAPTLLS
ncbi:MAG: hypothetical protein EXS15_03510 [Phycisphaerales bacterium]|nr:hypothetical protein [Phycisphaerales bacterium]